MFKAGDKVRVLAAAKDSVYPSLVGTVQVVVEQRAGGDVRLEGKAYCSICCENHEIADIPGKYLELVKEEEPKMKVLADGDVFVCASGDKVLLCKDCESYFEIFEKNRAEYGYTFWRELKDYDRDGTPSVNWGRDSSCTLKTFVGNVRKKTAATRSEVMKTVLEAINDGKLLGMTYTNSKGAETYRIVKPNTISESNGLQMTCFCHLRNELRTLKLANIKKCWLLGKAE